MMASASVGADVALAAQPQFAVSSGAPETNDSGKVRLLQATPVLHPGGETVQAARWQWHAQYEGNRWLETPLAHGAANREIPFGTSQREEDFNELRQSVATLSNGSLVSVWNDRTDNGLDVLMQWLRRDGPGLAPLWPGGRVVANGPTAEADPVTVGDLQGGAFVVWINSAAGGGSSRLLAQRYDASGVALWSTGAEVASTGLFQSEPTLVADGFGGVFVCYQAFPSSGSDFEIVCQHLDADGAALWGSAGLTAGGEPGWRVLPKAVADATGGVIVFWRNQRGIGDGVVEMMLIEGQRFSPLGSRLWGDGGLSVRTTNLAEPDGYGFGIHDVQGDGAGGAVLGFNDWSGTSTPDLDVFAQRVAADGTLLWGDAGGGVLVAGDGAHIQHEATIALPDGGAAIAVYEDVSATESRLWVYRLGPDGGHLWPGGVLLHDPAATALDYGVYGVFSDGLLQLIWTHQTQAATLEMDVKLARFRLDGERHDGIAGSTLSAAPDAQFTRGLALSPNNLHALAIWDDRRSGSWDDLDTYGASFQRTGLFSDGFESGNALMWSSVNWFGVD